MSKKNLSFNWTSLNIQLRQSLFSHYQKSVVSDFLFNVFLNEMQIDKSVLTI